MKLFFTLVTLFLCAAAFGLPNITARVDIAGGKVTESIIVNLPENVEVWAIGVNTPTPLVRVGQFFPVAKDVKVGGYIGERNGNMFATAAVAVSPTVANGRLVSQIEYQHFLNAPIADSLSIPEARILWPVTKNIEAGPAGFGSFQSGKKPQIHLGLAAKIQLSKELGFYTRWCPLGDGASLRTQFTYSF